MGKEDFVAAIYDSLGDVVSKSVDCQYDFDDESLEFYDAGGNLQGRYAVGFNGVGEHRDICCFLAAIFYGVPDDDFLEFRENFLFHV
jgi:hypothetical protein